MDKKANEIFKVVKLPGSGIRSITINQFMLEKFDNGMVMISIENKGKINTPRTIEYKRIL